MSAEETPRFTVFGNPIEQSKSPLIHQLFAQQTNIALEYSKTLTDETKFLASLDAFFSLPDALGCNVTAPFKQLAAKWVHELTPLAKEARAINTIVRLPNDHFIGDTTDGRGLVADLLRLNSQLRDTRVLLIGAGGAASGVVLPLLAEGVEHIDVVNRTAQKALALSGNFNSEQVQGFGFEQLNNANNNYDIIVNCTSASLSQQLPLLSDSILQSTRLAYDMVYLSKPTVFMQHATELGVPVVSDGLGMLVGQAAHSFSMWHHVMPDMTPVLTELRKAL